MQQAFYNGHYRYHGAKVQHVLQVDGIAYSFTCPLWNHDSIVLQYSSMLLVLSSVLINGMPAITVTDKAYGCTPHLQPLHTDAEIRVMAPAQRNN
jgi:hypothetical protein